MSVKNTPEQQGQKAVTSKRKFKTKVSEADKAIGAKISEARKAQKIPLKTLGALLRVSHQQIQKYEKGENRISASQVKEVADFMGIPAAYFLNEVVKEEETLNIVWNNLPKDELREQFIIMMRTIGRLSQATD